MATQTTIGYNSGTGINFSDNVSGVSGGTQTTAGPYKVITSTASAIDIVAGLHAMTVGRAATTLIPTGTPIVVVTYYRLQVTAVTNYTLNLLIFYCNGYQSVAYPFTGVTGERYIAGFAVFGFNNPSSLSDLTISMTTSCLEKRNQQIWTHTYVYTNSLGVTYSGQA